jgi:hypothetical protein
MANILLRSVSETLVCGQCGWRLANRNKKVTLICWVKNFKEGIHWNFKVLQHKRLPWGCGSSSSCHVAVFVLCLTRHNSIFSAGLVVPDVSKDRSPLIFRGLRSRRGLWVLLVKKRKKCRPNRGRYGWGSCVSSKLWKRQLCDTAPHPRSLEFPTHCLIV